RSRLIRWHLKSIENWNWPVIDSDKAKRYRRENWDCEKILINLLRLRQSTRGQRESYFRKSPGIPMRWCRFRSCLFHRAGFVRSRESQSAKIPQLPATQIE